MDGKNENDDVASNMFIKEELDVDIKEEVLEDVKNNMFDGTNSNQVGGNAVPQYGCCFCNSKFSTKPELLRHMTQYSGDRPFRWSACSPDFVPGLIADGGAVKTEETLAAVAEKERELSKTATGRKVRKPKSDAGRPTHIGRQRKKRMEAANRAQDNSSSLSKGGTTGNNSQVKDENEVIGDNNNRVEIHGPTDVLPFHCQHCGAGFADKIAMGRHSTQVVGPRPFLVTGCSPAVVRRLTAELRQTKCFKCDICQHTFYRKSRLILHKERFHGAPHLKKEFKCDICFKVFTKKSLLLYHITQHESLTEELTSHIRMSCRFCRKVFSFYSQFELHVLRHTKDKPFQCDECGKCYGTRRALEIHKNWHAGVKPIICEYCAKSFRSRSYLARHIRSHTGERNYVCNDCGKAFADKQLLREHVKVHTGEKPFKCNTCGKSFTHKATLHNHKRLHSGEKPFCCSLCPSSFVYRHHLMVHMRSHSGERPIRKNTCKICGRSFLQKINLTRHLDDHHKNSQISCELQNGD